MRIVDILAKKLPAKLLRLAPRSYDLIGTIALVEIPRGMVRYEKKISEAIMRIHQPIRTVLKKTTAMKGRYRVRGVKHIAGEKTTETVYQEHGVRMRLDIAKVYFSVRLSHERQRIAEQVKRGERVFVFFAGVGPFALVIAKKQPRCRVTGIELNPAAASYFMDNIRLNKLPNCQALKGDVKKLAQKLGRSADRILMPLPKDAGDFLDSAFAVARPGAIVHFYQFSDRDAPFQEPIKKMERAAKKNKSNIKILYKKIVRPYAPKIVQVCVDFQITTGLVQGNAAYFRRG